MGSDPNWREAVEDAVRVLLDNSGDTNPRREGLMRTPQRFAIAWAEIMRGYRADPAAILAADFEGDGYDEIVLMRGIPFTSWCEHHLFPFTGHAHVGYLPNGRVAGLSKLVRLVTECYAPRLQMQERITVQVADALVEHLEARGAIVVLEAEHSCVGCRGVRVPSVVTVTSAVRGVFKDKPEARAEALALINRSHP